MGKIIELTGLVFNYLTVINRDFNKNNKKIYWNCKCKCGNIISVRGDLLTNNNTKSCGCLQKEMLTKHGLYNTQEYNILQSIKEQCYSVCNAQYKNYGAIGIKVHDSWLENNTSPVNFLKDMGHKPTNKHFLIRLNFKGNFEPSNCRWVTKEERDIIRNMNKIITYNNKDYTLSELSELTNIDYDLIINRLSKGWTIENIINIGSDTKVKLSTYNTFNNNISKFKINKFNIDKTFYISEEQFSSNIDMRIHKDINAFELKEPIKYLGHSPFTGFYHVPGFDLIINENNIVIRLSTGKVLQRIPNAYNRIVLSYNLYTDNGIINYSTALSRAIALTFIPRPLLHYNKDYSELEVNHIDGNPSNNNITNLEWCIGEENMKHAKDNELLTYYKPILAKHKLTNEIKRYTNIKDCERDHCMLESQLQQHLLSDYFGSAYKNDWIFKLDDGSEWPKQTKTNIKEIGDGLIVFARNLETNEILRFTSIRKCSKHFYVSEDTLYKNLNIKQSGTFHKNGWIFKYDNGLDWVIYPIKDIKELKHYIWK